jgi:hypothetical protein
MTRKLNEVVANAEHYADSAIDVWENLTANQTDRAGHAAARLASTLANNVDAEVLALQLTKNSRKNNPEAPEIFTEQEVIAVGKFYMANRTRSVLPKAQAGALIREQKAADGVDKITPTFKRS